MYVSLLTHWSAYLCDLYVHAKKRFLQCTEKVTCSRKQLQPAALGSGELCVEKFNSSGCSLMTTTILMPSSKVFLAFLLLHSIWLPSPCTRALAPPSCCSLEAIFPAYAVSLAETSMAVPVQISVAAGQMTTTFLPPLPVEDAFHRREVGPAFP